LLQPLAERYREALSRCAGAGFTRRELQVAELLVRGRSNAQICASLAMSRATLRTHLNRIYAKLQACGTAIDFLPGSRTAEAGSAA
jgi:DNA-binding CsgD family transcriptional regulator